MQEAGNPLGRSPIDHRAHLSQTTITLTFTLVGVVNGWAWKNLGGPEWSFTIISSSGLHIYNMLTETML